jgi:soluble lytic murein transglycosylase-like protein
MAQAGRDPEPSFLERATQLEPLIIDSAKRYGIDPRILRSLCFIESRFRLNAVSPKGARGPMQFMPETAARYGLKNPNNPKAAIDAAAHYLRDLLVRFNGRLDLALAAYNSGEGAVESFQTGRPLRLASGKIINPRGVITGGMPPYDETRNYVTSIMSLVAQPSQMVTNTVFVTPRRGNESLRDSKNRNLIPDKAINTKTPQPRPKSNSNTFIEVE